MAPPPQARSRPCQSFFCQADAKQRLDWHARTRARPKRRTVSAAASQPGPARLPLQGLSPQLLALADRYAREHERVLLVRPEPKPPVYKSSHSALRTVDWAELPELCSGMDVVIDGGRLAQQGLVMDLQKCRWDVLGRVEEVLHEVHRLLSFLKPGGVLLTEIGGDPVDFLLSYITAFPVRVRDLASAPGTQLFEVSVEERVDAGHLEDVLEEQVFAERSHRRYADALDVALEGDCLEILDVGGGDGHMAEWWMASGHSISLLEVDDHQVELAKRRLGEARVYHHDGVSPWPYPDDSFDVCLLLHVLHHIPTEEALALTLSEAARVTRRQVLVMEDQPRAGVSPGWCRLAVAVTANHFIPFKQDPKIFMRNVRPGEVWCSFFRRAGLRVSSERLIAGTLQHPVPHTLYDLRPSR